MKKEKNINRNAEKNFNYIIKKIEENPEIMKKITYKNLERLKVMYMIKLERLEKEKERLLRETKGSGNF